MIDEKEVDEDNIYGEDYGEGYEDSWTTINIQEENNSYDDTVLNNRKLLPFQLEDYMTGEE